MTLEDQMTDSDRAVFHKIYPLMFELEEGLGEYISLKLWANLTRLLATRGTPIEDLTALLTTQYEAQSAYNASSTH